MLIFHMRRKEGGLVPLELAICEAAAHLMRRGVAEFHGYAVAKALGDAADARLLTAYGTLYRALSRLQKMGLLVSRWEDPNLSEIEGRPRRRLYCLTPAGEAALVEARKSASRRGAVEKPGEGLAPA